MLTGKGYTDVKAWVCVHADSHAGFLLEFGIRSRSVSRIYSAGRSAG
jgi:hypothetical protein